MTIDEGGHRYYGAHAWFMALPDHVGWYCPDCRPGGVATPNSSAAQGAMSFDVPHVRASGLYHPVGPVAIVGGKHVTLSELLGYDVGTSVAHTSEVPAEGQGGEPDTASTEYRNPVDVGGSGPTAGSIPYPWIPRHKGEWLEEVTERAAIFEYMGGFERAIADKMARDLVGAWT